MTAPEFAVPLSAVALRLTDEVGQAVLDWVAAGDLTAAAALDQHVASVRAALVSCPADEPATARLAGQAARSASTAPTQADCPDAPFADSAWYTEPTPSLKLLLHYACGFVEAAVRADWWPGEIVADSIEFEALRLAAVCHLVRRAETAAAVPPDLR
jgi:Family of unknown function (DUF6401)